MTQKSVRAALIEKYLTDGDRAVLAQCRGGFDTSDTERRERWALYIRGFRHYFGLSQSEASRVLNVVYNTFISHELEQRMPYYSNAQEIVLNARLFKLIIDEIIAGRLALLKKWEPAKFALAASAPGRRIDLFVSPLCGRERQALIDMCALVHEKGLPMDEILYFARDFFPFLEAMLQEASQSPARMEIFIPFKDYLTGNHLACLQAIFTTWLSQREGVEEPMEIEEVGEFAELFHG